MNGIHTKVIADNNLTLHIVTGRIGNDDITDTLRNMPEKGTDDVIWDFTNGNAIDLLSSYKPKNLNGLLRLYGEKRRGGRTALVFSREIDYGISRIIESYLNMISFSVNVKSFRTMSEACEWMGIDPLEKTETISE